MPRPQPQPQPQTRARGRDDRSPRHKIAPVQPLWRPIAGRVFDRWPRPGRVVAVVGPKPPQPPLPLRRLAWTGPSSGGQLVWTLDLAGMGRHLGGRPIRLRAACGAGWRVRAWGHDRNSGFGEGLWPVRRR